VIEGSSLKRLCQILVSEPRFQSCRPAAIAMWSAQSKCRPDCAVNLEWNEYWEREMWWQMTLFGMVADALMQKGIPAHCEFSHDMYDADPIRFRWVCALRAEGVSLGSRGSIVASKMRQHIDENDTHMFDMVDFSSQDYVPGPGSLLDLFRQVPRVPEAEKTFFKIVIDEMASFVDAHMLALATRPLATAMRSSRL
jgi:hypothetical protein